MKSRFTALGALGIAALAYVLGQNDGEEPGSTAEDIAQVREMGVVIGANAVGAVQDVRAVAGPALADLGNAAAGAADPTTAAAQEESLITVPPGTPGG